MLEQFDILRDATRGFVGTSFVIAPVPFSSTARALAYGACVVYHDLICCASIDATGVVNVPPPVSFNNLHFAATSMFFKSRYSFVLAYPFASFH